MIKIKSSVDIIYLLHANYGTSLTACEFFSNIDITSLRQFYDVNLICLVKGSVDNNKINFHRNDIQIFSVPNIGRDIYSYHYYVHRFSKADFVCFFNTSSKIRSSNFLSTCLKQVSANYFDVCSATGSYGKLMNSKYFDLLKPLLYSPNERFSNNLKFILCKIIEYLLRIFSISLIPHVRTNACVARREVFIGTFDTFYFGVAPKSKLFSLLYESSSRGLSGYITLKGGRLLIVGSDGVVYRVHQWPASGTYCSLEQKNLAVEDNRTKEFEHSSSFKKMKLYIATWGSGG